MKISRLLSVVVLLGTFILAFGCGSSEPAPEVVAGHTGGNISAADSIRVRLNRNVVDPSVLNIPLDPSPIDFRPAIAGVAMWTAPDRLQFTPDNRLQPGQEFTAVVRLGKIVPDWKDSKDFEFKFSVMEQTFKVELDGLEVRDPSRPEIQRFSGRVVTADVAASESVEKVLKAFHDNSPLTLRWQHDDSRTHSFFIDDIVREETETFLELRWNGEKIGASLEGETEVRIPPRNEFSVISCRAIQGDERLVEIRFTDALHPSQDLQGLVRIGDHSDLRFVAEGSVLKVYTTGRWSDEERVTIDAMVRSSLNAVLAQVQETTIYFEAQKPRVSFSGQGIIVPTSGDNPTLPIEVTALRAVRIEATHIFGPNMPQFFQVNDLDDDDELNRVGRPVWKKRVVLAPDPTEAGENRRYGLDLKPLIENFPGGMYRLRLTFNRGDIDYECSEELSLPPLDEDDNTDQTWDAADDSYWDQWEEQQGVNWSSLYDNRENPCHPGYYRSYYDHDIEVSRNVMLSDIGLTAKGGRDGSLTVLATDLRTAAPRPGARIRVLDFQQQLLAEGVTGYDGLVYLEVDTQPFLLVAEDGDQVGYLKLDDGLALPVSSFDVSGAEVSKGIKAFLYAERGVWRPGDTMHLGFILSDSENRLPPDHPVVFELRNPQDQLVKRLTRTSSTNDFYTFEVATAEDAVTGTYRAKVTVGGVSFEKDLKVATIRPNRLKIQVELDEPEIRAPNHILAATLDAAWLHGGEAADMRATIEARLQQAKTVFEAFPDFTFDDPTREIYPDDDVVFEGRLDAHGRAKVAGRMDSPVRSPGKLTAILTTKVFEAGGAFSISEGRASFSPYERYVGLRTPQGDKARGMLLTDQDQRVDLALVDQDGRPLDGTVDVRLYKIDWRWWWEKGEGDLAEYAATSSLTPVASGQAKVAQGKGNWSFQINYPQWGRYLLLAEDEKSHHRSGRVIFIDWPGWAGKARKDSGDGAAVLDLAADKEKVTVGEEVTLSIPSAGEGRILVTLESGTRILQSEFIESSGERTRYTFTTTPEMVPNIYAAVSFIQPHDHGQNDLPIRMYGFLPIEVESALSRLNPVIKAPKEMRPESSASISVSEKNGRPMTYTLAIVDEGLLGLTGFSTPDPWGHFFRREALGVKTWDLYDEVVGAFGAALERLLAIGGDEAGKVKPGQRKTRRFPPMVRFLGPFELKEDERNSHEIDIPLYIGAVRVMVVAGDGNAFGSAETEVPVRKKLMVLGTLPRMLAPGESLEMPVAVFTMDGGPKKVEITVTTDGPIEVKGPSKQTLELSGPGEENLGFSLATLDHEGKGSITIEARGSGEKSSHQTHLDIRRAGRRVTDVLGTELDPGDTWKISVTLPGSIGSNEAVLEVSRIPPLDLGRRLDGLLRYPYGCLEQTTSSVFPQIYLSRLVKLEPDQKQEITENIKSGIQRLRRFQMANGGMRSWPSASGGFWTQSPHSKVDEWATSYAGHFLLQAKRAGFVVSAEMLQSWEVFQKNKARSWITGGESDELMQAYRLHTLALAGAADLSAMNRLRERSNLNPAAAWQLAAAYLLAGQTETARDLTRGLKTQFPNYNELSGTYGSRIRDQALALQTLYLLGDDERASALASEISAALASDAWLSTQTTAFALLALAEGAGSTGEARDFTFSYRWSDGDEVTLEEEHAIVRRTLQTGQQTEAELVVSNEGVGRIYPRIITSGMPAPGSTHSASHGLGLVTTFELNDGEVIEPARLDQGTEFVAIVTVKNIQRARTLRGLALSIPAAEGWEIGTVTVDGPIEYQDIRDDRVDVFFDLEPEGSLTVQVRFNAAFIGRYALPMVTVEAMYDATISARRAGRWVRVVAPGS
ncbi:MAG: hypothetical protein K8R59_05935 [Thermoanaerobaculales bacterium]|nr:hypothetical protein [Thermoanaerobaculales bacterium]